MSNKMFYPIEKFPVARDDKYYLAWPDLALTGDGRLICVKNDCVPHTDRSYTRIMLCESSDRGRSWSEPRALTGGTRNLPYSYNCPRISRLRDNRLVIIVDRVPTGGEKDADKAVNELYFSSDNGSSWSPAQEIPLRGIVPDKLVELDNGRWLAAAHYPHCRKLAEFLRYSDDGGQTWSEPVTVAQDSRYNLCEVSLLPMGNGVVVALLRENSALGLDCFKTISYDNGQSWSPLIHFPLPGCHRPVAGKLNEGVYLITHRFIQGGYGWPETWDHNFFAAITTRESLLAIRRNDAQTRIMPVDYDRSPYADTGYSGWVQFDDGEIYVVNYIVDDHYDKGQIRGYSMRMESFLFMPPEGVSGLPTHQHKVF